MIVIPDAYDISQYQGSSTDFSILKNEIQFLIIRVQHGSSNEDDLHVQFENSAIANGIPYGVYAYSNYLDSNDAIVEANDFWNRTNRDSALFYVVDVEEVSTTNTSDLVPATQAFIDRLRELGAQKVGLYSGESFFNSNGLSAIDCDFLWIAKYGINDGVEHTQPDVGEPIDIWQYTSVYDSAGISENTVDANKFIGGTKSLSYFTTSSNDIDPEPTNTPPTIPNYSFTTTYQTQLSSNVIGNDIDGDSLTYSEQSSPTNGSVSVQNNGDFTYTPANQFIGEDSFQIEVSDGNNGTAISTITITVTAPIVDAPTPDPLSPISYAQYLVVSDSATIYSDRSTASSQITIIPKWSVVWYQTNTSDGSFSYVKYIDNRNISYYGYVQTNQLKTQVEIDAERPNYDPKFDTVLDGDILETIAQRNNTTVDMLKLLNGYRGEIFLTVGEEIRTK